MVQHLLPDKAIDLVNEAASALHLAQESEPDELEALGREIMMLKIEREWLCAQSDAFSTEHHAAVEAVLTAKRTQTKECTIVLQAECVCLDRQYLQLTLLEGLGTPTDVLLEVRRLGSPPSVRRPHTHELW